MNDQTPVLLTSTPEWEGERLPSLGLTESRVPAEDPNLWQYELTSRLVTQDKTKSKTKTQYKPTVLRQIWWIACLIVLSVACHFVVSHYIVTAVQVQGRSMMPTLKDGERYFLNRAVYYCRAPQRGDLVVVHDPGHKDFAVKRLVGMPGESVQIRDNGVYINGKRLKEPYLAPDTQTRAGELKGGVMMLGADCYFLLGDNRTNSEDSRTYGPIGRKFIVGMIAK
jgi:signal peptidase I